MEATANKDLLSLRAAGLVAALGAISLLVWYLPDALPVSYASGSWAVAANDFAQGVFYRPVFSEMGYGGTRYTPLFFVLHGSLIYLFGDPVTTGFCLSLASALMTVLGTYYLLRELKIEAKIAVPFTLFMLGSIHFQHVAIELRCAFLVAALNLWGMIFALRYLRSEKTGAWKALPLAASITLFVLAFLTKLSMVGGIAAFVVYAFLQGQRKTSLKFIAWPAVLIPCSLLLIHLLSEGRAWASFQACITAEHDLTYILGAPLRFLRVTAEDPFLLLLFAFTFPIFALTVRTSWHTFPYLYFIVTLASTLVIFGASGIAGDHMIDLLASSITILAVQFSEGRQFVTKFNWYFRLVTTLMLISLIPGAPSIRTHFTHRVKPTRESVAYIGQRLGPHAKNLISEQPLVPMLLGENPILLDPFHLRYLSEKDPAIYRDFVGKLQRHEFGAIVLLDRSGLPEDELEGNLAKRSVMQTFLDEIKADYCLSFVRRPFVVYEPKHRVARAESPTKFTR